MALLEPQTDIGNYELEATTIGRFLNVDDITEVGTQLPDQAQLFELEPLDVEVDVLIRGLREEALGAMTTLGTLEAARQILEINKSLKGLLTEEVVEEARYEAIDQAAVWRQRTDKICTLITRTFPEQELVHPVFSGKNVFYTDEHRILSWNPEDGQIVAYSSVIAQHEMTAGMKVASEEDWHQLVFRIYAYL